MKLNEIKLSAKEKAEEFVKRYVVVSALGVSATCTVRDDGVIDVEKGDTPFMLANFKFTKLPVKFGIAEGNFFLSGLDKLESLEGSPDEVKGEFSCYACTNLKSLKDSPRTVGSLDCSRCISLTSFDGLPSVIKGSFRCHGCINLTSLKGVPTIINDYFNCSNCPSLTSFEGCPEKINSNFVANHCLSLNTLRFLPKEVNGIIFLKSCPNVRDYLNLLNVKGVTRIEITTDTKSSDMFRVQEILNKYLPKHDMLNCQDELIEAGLEKYAEID